MKTIKVNETEYKLADIGIEESKALIEWVKPRLADPMQFILKELAGIPDNLKESILKEHIAMKRQPITLDNPDVQALLRTPEGSEFVLIQMWQKHNELSKEQVWELHKAAVEQLGETYAK